MVPRGIIQLLYRRNRPSRHQKKGVSATCLWRFAFGTLEKGESILIMDAHPGLPILLARKRGHGNRADDVASG